jgi:uncharacterized protein
MPNIFKLIQTSAILFCLSSAWSSSYAGLLDRSPQGAVNDFASRLSEPVRNSLESLSKALLEKIGVSLVLVVTPDCEGADINDLATRLYEKWGIGKKGVDEGILVLVAVNDRRIRIETGYGSEGYLTDAEASRIIRDVVAPALTLQHWDDGCTAAMISIASLAARAHHTTLRDITGEDISEVPASPVRPGKVNILGILFFGVLLLFLLSSRGGRSLLLFMLLTSMSSSGRSNGRGFGGGFGGGGFSGFGGGMSGGGGASGRF